MPTDMKGLEERITDYLTGGGLFNPEMADHAAVRDLLIECRSALSDIESAKPKESEGWRELMKELADDLEAEIAARYPPEMREYPSIATKANLDMEPVHRARAMLSAAGDGHDR